MRGAGSSITIGVLAIGLLFTAGCGKKNDPIPNPPPIGATGSATPTEEPTGEPTSDAQQAGGAKLGVTFSVPKTWLIIDPAKKDLAKTLKTKGVKTALATAITQQVGRLKALKGIYAFDAQAAKDAQAKYPTNVTAICVPGKASTKAAQLIPQMKTALTQRGFKNIEVAEATVGDVEAAKATFKTKIGTLTLTGTQVMLPGKKQCVITMVTDQADADATFDEITNSIKPATTS